ncbi:hypothetical protein [Flavobacterium subsaxonicum]|uniref:Uncharacterized protein n=1 Tax=Flavobacterium subsaxonicum WB 4.1-42 = DSM 21790 TaxID=1121898 RepID=A0A0A2MJ68_9FLAO|nr:hypothetical protein [Flavobacterium subsaxonicum]KGO91621.1 hypothetical protein Q766_16445 [Flavobacterium subsaxonicum WB 4.1-42 = DSM 21790]
MKNLSFILLILVGCSTKKDEKIVPNHSVDFYCNKVYYAKGEVQATVFEITAVSSDTLILDDYNHDAEYREITKNEKGFSLFNLYSGEERKLSDLISNDYRYILPGKYKWHLYSSRIFDSHLNSIIENEGWVIKYNGKIVIKNNPEPQIKIQSNSIYIPLKEINPQKMDSEEIMYLGVNENDL